MDKLRDLPWTRITAEAVAIVVSILMAFSIEAWWSEQQLREEEQKILANLLSSFVRIEGELRDSRRFYSAIRGSSLALIAIGSGPPDAADGEEIDRLFRQIIFFGESWSWSNSDLDAAISSGDIELISNSELRQELGRWQARLGVVRDLISRDADFYTDRLRPYLSENMYLPQFTKWALPIPGLPERDPYVFGGAKIDVPSNQDHRELVWRKSFQNLLWERAGYTNDILFVGIGFEDGSTKSLSTIGADLNSTINLIKTELNAD